MIRQVEAAVLLSLDQAETFGRWILNVVLRAKETNGAVRNSSTPTGTSAD